MTGQETIKAIQTRYAGYLFRSRLEARWAVFFDALKLDWQYEPEGFDLPSGQRYLPDFRINLRRKVLWADVKPSGVECAEIAELMQNAPDNWVGIILNDIPDPRKSYQGHDVWFGGSIIDPDVKVHNGGGWDSPYMFCICSKCGETGFEFEGRAERIGCCRELIQKNPLNRAEDRITNAFAKARAARFEHESHENY
jgi:hypothetical protein